MKTTENPPSLRITVFGATGMVGSRVVAEALSRGHRVTAVVRRAESFQKLPAKATPRLGDASKPSEVAELSSGQDLVISATRPRPGDEPQLVVVANALMAGLTKSGTRLLLVGGAANLTVPDADGATVLSAANFLPAASRAISEACFEQLQACRKEQTVDWAYLSPPAELTPGTRTGRYRLGRDELLVDAEGRSRISVEDLAVVLLDEAERPAHHRTNFTAAY